MNAYLIFDFAAKSAALLLLVSGLHMLWRGASAAQRSLVWLAAFLCLLAMPLSGLMKPLWTLVQEVQVVTVTVAPIEIHDVAPVTAFAGAAVTTTAAAPAPQLPRLSPLQAGLAVWVAGALLLMAHRGLGSWRLRRLRKSSLPCANPGILQQVADLREVMGIRRPVEVRVSSALPVPVTWGVFRPVILMPAKCDEWPDDVLSAALLHELAHIRHLDAAARVLATLGCALHWPNPLVWLAARAWRADQERAADDLVLRAGIPARDYACQLLDAARAFRSREVMHAPVLAMARPATLERRLTAIMDGKRNRGAASPKAQRLIAIVGLLVFGTLLCLRVQGEPVQVERVTSNPASAELLIGIEVTSINLSLAATTEAAPLPKDGEITPEDEAALMRRLLQDKETKISRYPRMVTKDGSEVRFRSVVTDKTSNVTDGWEVTVLPKTSGKGIRTEMRIAKTAAGVKSERTETRDVPDGRTMLLVQEGGADLLLVKASRLASARKVTTATSPADAGKGDHILIRSRIVEVPKGRLLESFRQGSRTEVLVLSEPRAKDFDLKLQEALRSPAGLKILSSPSVITGSGQEATVEVLLDVPVPGKEPVQTGPVLSFVPHLRPGEIELFADLLYNQKIGEKDGYPIMSSRRLKTSAKLKKGEMAMFQFASAEPGQSELVCLVSAQPVAAEAPPAQDARQIASKVILPRLHFAGATLDEAIEFLRVKSRASGVQGAENLNINIGAKAPAASLTLDLIDVPLAEALRDVAELAGMDLRFDGNSITFVSGGNSRSVPQPPSAGPKDAPPAPLSSVERQAASIILPQVTFSEATLDEAVEFLRTRSRQLDPLGDAVNIVISAGVKAPKLTLDLKNVPVSSVLQYVAQLSDLNLSYRGNVVTLSQRDASQGSPSAPQPAASPAAARAKAIILPSVKFVDRTLLEAVDFLRMKGRDLAPDKQGVNIILADQSQASKANITCDLRQVSLLQALHIAAAQAGFNLQADRDALVLTPIKK